jgi:hypothetical protein
MKDGDEKGRGPSPHTDLDQETFDDVSEVDLDDVYDMAGKSRPPPRPEPTAPTARPPGPPAPPLHGSTEGKVLQALTLIVVGIVLLLNTTGIADWGIWWNLVRLWPIWLIVIGLSIILGWSRWLRFASRLLFLLALVFILSVSVLAGNPSLLESANLTLPAWASRLASPEGGAESIIKTFVIKKADAPDAETRRISLDMAFGELGFGDDESDRYLVLNSDYPEGVGDPHLTRTVSGGLLEILFEARGGQGSSWGVGRTMPAYDFIAGLPSVKTDIDINVGAGKGRMHLARLTTGRIEAEAGTGELEIVLEEGAVPGEGLWVKVGAGRIRLVLPAAVGYRIAYTVGVGSLTVEGISAGVAGGGQAVHMSSNYSIASKTIRITADVGAGTFEVVTKP